MNTIEYITELTKITGDKQPEVRWFVDEDESLNMHTAVLIDGEVSNNLTQQTGGQSNWGNDGHYEMILLTALAGMRSTVDRKAGKILPGISDEERAFVESQAAEFPEIEAIING